MERESFEKRLSILNDENYLANSNYLKLEESVKLERESFEKRLSNLNDENCNLKNDLKILSPLQLRYPVISKEDNVLDLKLNLFHILNIEKEEIENFSHKDIVKKIKTILFKVHPDRVRSSYQSLINYRCSFFNNLHAIFSDEENYEIYLNKFLTTFNFSSNNFCKYCNYNMYRSNRFNNNDISGNHHCLTRLDI